MVKENNYFVLTIFLSLVFFINSVHADSKSRASPPPLSNAVLNKTPIIQSSKKPSGLAGHWTGSAQCKRGYKNVYVELKSSGHNTYQGTLRIVGSKTDHVIKFDAKKETSRFALRAYSVNSHDITPGRVEYMVTNIGKVAEYDGFARYLSIGLYGTGGCSRAIVSRFYRSPLLGGLYQDWGSYDKKCQGFTAWLKQGFQREELRRERLEEWHDLLSTKSSKDVDIPEALIEPLFSETFGSPYIELEQEQVRELLFQFGECSVLTVGYDNDLVTYFEQRILSGDRNQLLNALIPSRVQDHYRDQVAPEFSQRDMRDALEQRNNARVELELAALKMKDIEEVKQVRQEARNALKDLPLFALPDIENFVRKIRSIQARVVKKDTSHNAKSTLALLNQNMTDNERSDFWPGHVLLSSPFTHPIYIEQNVVEGGSCPEWVPIKVPIRSLLTLGQTENIDYPKQFFFYAFQSLRYICGWPTRDTSGTGWKAHIEFYFANKHVGEARIFQRDYSMKITDLDAVENDWARDKNHPDYSYDVAFSTMVGGVIDRAGAKIRELTLADLQMLYDAGDSQAGLYLSIPKDKDHYSTGSTQRNLSHDLSTAPRDADLDQLSEAAHRGSATAAHALALTTLVEKRLIEVDHSHQVNEFDDLSKYEKLELVLLIAKAKHAGVYWSIFFDDAIERWSIKLDAAEELIARDGMTAKASSLASSTLILSTDLDTGRARTALAKYFSKKCNAFSALFSNEPLTVGNTWKIVGDWCISRTPELISGIYVETRIRIAGVSDLQCSGGNTRKSCRLHYAIHCQMEDNGPNIKLTRTRTRYAMKFCRTLEAVDYPVTADFVTIGDGIWHVEGSVKQAK